MSAKKELLSFIYKYKGNDWFTRTLKEMLDKCIEEERDSEKEEVLDDVMTIVKEKISEKEYLIETMVELTDFRWKNSAVKIH